MIFTAAQQVAASEHLLCEAGRAVSFAGPLTAAYAVVIVAVVLLWATGVLAFGRDPASPSRQDRASRSTRSSLVGRQTPAV